MKDALDIFLTFVLAFWLIVGHWLVIYSFDINAKASIVTGLLIVHFDMFLVATFISGYKKTKDKESEESK